MKESEADRVPVVATLRLSDGRVFDTHTDVLREGVDSHEFWWTDGNAGCDCNRSLFLNREHGLNLGMEEEDGEFCMPCGHTLTLLKLVIDGVEQPGAVEEIPSENAEVPPAGKPA